DDGRSCGCARTPRRRLRHVAGGAGRGAVLRGGAARILDRPRVVARARARGTAHREAGFLMDYKSSGVDIAAGNETVRRIRALARSTSAPGVLSDIGSFGGLYRLDPAW